MPTYTELKEILKDYELRGYPTTPNKNLLIC